MLKAKFQRTYRSKNGNTTFVYGVSGSTEELEAFKAAQNDFYREDEETGKPLWFTVDYAGKNTDLVITRSGKVIADKSEMDQAASLASQYGGNFGQALANEAARNIMNAKESDDSAAKNANNAPEFDGV